MGFVWGLYEILAFIWVLYFWRPKPIGHHHRGVFSWAWVWFTYLFLWSKYSPSSEEHEYTLPHVVAEVLIGNCISLTAQGGVCIPPSQSTRSLRQAIPRISRSFITWFKTWRICSSKNNPTSHYVSDSFRWRSFLIKISFGRSYLMSSCMSYRSYVHLGCN